MGADPTPDVAVLAASLADTVRDLQAYIEARADKIAAPLISATQRRADDMIDGYVKEREHERQRTDDLIRELRRQLDAAVKTCERQQRELKETREAVRRVESLRVWTNEDRKEFVFADELWAALAEAGSPAARALAALQQGRVAGGLERGE